MTSRAPYPVLLVMIVVALVLVALVQIPLTCKSPCLIHAAAEWHLSSPEPGKFSTQVVSRCPPCGRRRISVLQFGREDFVSFHGDNGVSTGDFVDPGQILGRIRSTENERLLHETLAQIDEAAATLALLRAGSKQDIVRMARGRLKGAIASEVLADAEIGRRKGLHSQGLISDEEFELAETRWELAAINVTIAESELAALESGEREEAQEAAYHALEALRLRGESLSEKIGWMAIRAPFHGRVATPLDTTLIFSVFKIDTMAVEIPVKETDMRVLRIGQEFSLRARTTPPRSLTGTIVAIDYRARIIAGRSRFIAIGLIENGDFSLHPGTSGEAIIRCGNYPLRVVLGNHVARGMSRLRLRQ